MANTKIFASPAQAVPVADTKNQAGGQAYTRSPKAALAQLAATGTFHDTCYTSAKTQLAEIEGLVAQVDAEFLAKLAVYSRHTAFMKDMPAYLCAVLAKRDVGLLAKVFDKVIDNGKMLRNFVQMVRSGVTGRKSLGTRPKKLVAAWLNNASDAQLLAASIGNSPSLADVIRLSHPCAKDKTRDAFFKYILGGGYVKEDLPDNVKALEAFRKGEAVTVPKVPFELLTSLPLSREDWTGIALNASWTQLRMNLNTFDRQGVFSGKKTITDKLARKLGDAEEVARAKVFPYQIMTAYLNTKESVPPVLQEALQDALEHAIMNVPCFDEEVAVLLDTSGSMTQPVTGYRETATTSVRCIDVASLFASAILRQNPTATIVPFDTRVHKAKLNARDSVVTNGTRLAAFGGGGTDCGMALRHLNSEKAAAKLVVYVSDNESWVSSARYRNRGTDVMAEWEKYKRRVPDAKLVCIDIVPNTTVQAATGKDILNVGGFSDNVFTVVKHFSEGRLTGDYWVREVESTVL
jgi:60 kDa SS-A/Ro ribonucleoprotein